MCLREREREREREGGGGEREREKGRLFLLYRKHETSNCNEDNEKLVANERTEDHRKSEQTMFKMGRRNSP